MVKEEFKKWLEQAESDLGVAKNSMKSGDYYASVFWCQQVVEKGLKSLMIKEGKGLERIHDLVVLGKRVNLPENFFNISAKLSVLYTKVRYPVFVDFKQEEVDNFIKFAEEVLEWVRKKI